MSPCDSYSLGHEHGRYQTADAVQRYEALERNALIDQKLAQRVLAAEVGADQLIEEHQTERLVQGDESGVDL